MLKCRGIVRVALTAMLAVVTINADRLFSAVQPPSNQRRITVLDGREVVEGEVIVRYRGQSGRIERERAEYQANSDGTEIIGRNGARKMRSRQLTTREMIARLQSNPDVEFVEPNYIIRANAMPNDPSFGNLWGLFNTGQVVDGQAGTPGADINATQAWDVTTGSRANIIGIIDTGIDYTHPDLAANVFTAPRQFSVTLGSTVVTCQPGTHGFNALNTSCNPYDDSGHGTHVAGIIGAVGNNNVGVTGVNWTATLLPLKVLDANGLGTTSDAIRAIEFAIKMKQALGADGNVRILNASWGGPNFSQSLADQIALANSADMLFVAAAGSEGHNNDSTPHYPASTNSPNVISVAGVDNNGARDTLSNYGPNSVHLGAPSSSTLSTFPNNDYGYLSGTSMSAPFVSGAAALVLARCSYTTAQLKDALLTTVDPVPSLAGMTISGGSLNAAAAVNSCGAPTVRVNGSLGAVTVDAGSTVAVQVSNGPGNISDWVMMVPAGAPAETWGPQYFYLSGTRTRPSTGLRNATINFTAPASGTWEFRFYANDSWTLLASSSVMTVSGSANPVPTVSSISPSTRTAGTGAFTLTVNGSGFVSSSQVRVNGSARTTSFMSANTLTAAIPASDIASAGSLAISVLNPSPGGGTSNNVTLTVTAPASTPALTVNGSSSPITVAGGSTITVGVSGGPGNVSDWVMIVAAGAPEMTWGPQYMYLSGTRTRPATGMTSATLSFLAPTAGGNFEFRFYANDGWTRLATSPVVTVTASGSSNPVPTISSLSPSSRTAGSGAFTLTVNGTGFVNGSEVRVDGASRTTTFVSATQLTAAIPAGDVASVGSKTITVFSPTPGGGSSNTATLAVTSPTSSGPALTVNGSSSPITVAGGSTITVGVSGGPGNVSDWVMIVAAGSPEMTWGPQYMYLSGTRTRPATGMTSATLSFTAPTGGGNFEFRFYANDGWTRLATSPVVTVTAASSSNPVPTLSSLSPSSRTAGSGAFTLTVNGTGFVAGSIVRVNGADRTTTFVSSTQLTAAIPAGDVASAGSKSITVFSPAPGGGTSGSLTLTVTTPTSSGPALTVNGSTSAITVAGGSTITVGVSGGPGNVSDWVMMVAAGAPAQTWGPQYMYLSGTRTRPATGMTSATLSFTAPTAGGQFEFRFYANDGWTLLATSPVVTVTAQSTTTGPTLTINGQSGPVSVAAGSTVSVTVSNGPGNVSDWVMMVPAGSPAGTWGDYKYLSGTRTRPATGMTNATISFAAPTAGNFEFRFYRNDTFDLLATSSQLTVTP